MADGIVFQTKDALDFLFKGDSKKGRVILNPLQSNFPDYNVQNTEKKDYYILSITASEEPSDGN